MRRDTASIARNTELSDLKKLLNLPLNNPARVKKFIAPKIILRMRTTFNGVWVATAVISPRGAKPPVLIAEKINEASCIISLYPKTTPMFRLTGRRKRTMRTTESV